jgi:NAD(P)-dependent dehydrogenase (short-subunit alcohol dehydrogenase family)
VAPETIMTPMNKKIFREAKNPQGLIDNWNSLHPLGRFGQSDEVGNVILFLASDESSFITDDVIRVDGGWLLMVVSSWHISSYEGCHLGLFHQFFVQFGIEIS